MRRGLCESAKQGRRCIDDLCSIGETLCGIDFDDFREELDDYPDYYPEDDDDGMTGEKCAGGA